MNEPIGIKAKAPMMAVSLVLSFLLWAVIQITQPPDSRDAPTRIGAVNTDKYLSRYIFPDDLGTVRVRIEGPQDQLSDDQAALERILKENRVYVYVDFNDLRPGMHNYPLNIVYSHNSPFTFTPLLASVAVDVEVRGEHRFQVTVDPTGEVPKDMNLMYAGATCQPSVAVVKGPASAVNQVKRVRAFLDLSTIDPHKASVEVLDPLDENDKAVPNVDIEPATVSVLPSMAPAAQSEMVLIEPVWVGHPALGFEVSNYSFEPNQVAVQGPPEILAKLRTVSTRPINLSGMSSSYSAETALDLPPGVKQFSPQPIKVRVTLKAQNTTSAKSPPPNQPITVP